MQHERTIFPKAASDYLSVYALNYRYVDSASHTDDIRFHSNGTRTTAMKNVRILALRLDTLTPFSDSGHTTYCNDFNDWTKNTVYIQGCYFEASTAFHVAYYDNGGAKVLSDGVSSDANGVVNSLCYFPGPPPTAAAGTWHAVIYNDSVSAPAETYSANDATSTRECTFTVDPAAIPEFPAVLAAIGVAVICFGFYWWIKQRACGVY